MGRKFALLDKVLAQGRLLLVLTINNPLWVDR